MSMFSGSLEGHLWQHEMCSQKVGLLIMVKNGLGYMVTSLMTGECYGTFLTKFLKQVVFLFLGICLTLVCL